MYSDEYATTDTKSHEWQYGYDNYNSINTHTISNIQQYIYNVTLPNITHIIQHMRQAHKIVFLAANTPATSCMQ